MACPLTHQSWRHFIISETERKGPCSSAAAAKDESIRLTPAPAHGAGRGDRAVQLKSGCNMNRDANDPDRPVLIARALIFERRIDEGAPSSALAFLLCWR